MTAAWLARLGFAVRTQITDIGTSTRLLARLLMLLGAALRRPALLRDQIHFLGNHSLALIGVSGLFVGFVLRSTPTVLSLDCSANADYNKYLPFWDWGVHAL